MMCCVQGLHAHVGPANLVEFTQVAAQSIGALKVSIAEPAHSKGKVHTL